MSKNNFISLAFFIFLIIGVMHALRLINGWEVQVESTVVSMWVSWVAVIFFGFLSWTGFRIKKE